jgi:succinate dehydrogenase/fumarate reductase flavoprotein subunit
MTVARILLPFALILAMGGCANLTQTQQRMLTGGAIGTAAGVGIAAVAGGPLLLGGLVGAAGGTIVGAAIH